MLNNSLIFYLTNLSQQVYNRKQNVQNIFEGRCESSEIYMIQTDNLKWFSLMRSLILFVFLYKAQELKRENRLVSKYSLNSALLLTRALWVLVRNSGLYREYVVTWDTVSTLIGDTSTFRG